MWNTDFILPSLMVLTILLVFYFVRPRLPNQPMATTNAIHTTMPTTNHGNNFGSTV